MEIDHLTIPVRSYDVGKRFYADALEPLGFRVLLDWPDRRRAYLGVAGAPSSIWVVETPNAGTLDVALALADRDEVIAFHNAAVAAGARSLGGPAKSEDMRGCYAARIADFDGNVIEAICREAAASLAA